MVKPVAWLWLMCLLLLLGLVSLVWNLIALLLYPLLPAPIGRRIGRGVIARVYRMFWALAGWSGLLRMDASALVPLADEPGLVVVANHPSLLDAMVLIAWLPRGACVMKSGLMRNPLLGPGARLAHYISNDSPRGLVREAVADLRIGGQVVMFPEGTRTTAPELHPFRPGFAMIAKLAPAPIQTVFIDTESPYLGKGWPLWRLPPLPIEFTVRVGRRFEPAAQPTRLAKEIEQYFATALRPGPRGAP
jgi:1-acyl-sn-glycerol-3-phosphate acyltransferase